MVILFPLFFMDVICHFMFSLSDTKHFVDLLFETLKTKSYLYKTDGNVPPTNPEAVNNITINNSKKLNSSEGREKTDSEKDSVSIASSYFI